MGVFDDKKFESLDWISQATEPIDSELNEILAAIPEEIVIDFPLFKEMIGENYSLDLDMSRVMAFLATKYTNKHLTWEQRGNITPCFKFEMDQGVDLDFENQVITGELKLVKIQSTMDEQVLKSLLGKEGIEACRSIFIPADGGLTRTNDVLEILGKCDDGLRTRSAQRKRSLLIKRLQDIFKANEWNIRDTELANKVGRWIRNYIVDNDLASWSNVCRLKVMTHKEQPIYSMEEAK